MIKTWINVVVISMNKMKIFLTRIVIRTNLPLTTSFFKHEKNEKIVLQYWHLLLFPAKHGKLSFYHLSQGFYMSIQGILKSLILSKYIKKVIEHPS